MKKIRRERWVAVVNENDYLLDEKQAHVLTEAINAGSRGVVQFNGFIISIPFLQEFYLDKSWEEIQYSDEELIALENKRLETSVPEKELTEEEIRQSEELKSLLIERSKLVARGYSFDEIKRIENRKTLTPEEESERKKLLLKQAEELRKRGL